MCEVSSMLSTESRVEGETIIPVLIGLRHECFHYSLLDYFSLYFSLAVRDLSNLVKPEDIVMSENLITLLAIVPKYSQKDWLSSYETLTSYVVSVSFISMFSLRVLFSWPLADECYICCMYCVARIISATLWPTFSLLCLTNSIIVQVPRSSKKLHEDNEYALYTVTLFRRVADNFRSSARDRGFQVCLPINCSGFSWCMNTEKVTKLHNSWHQLAYF